MNSAVDSNNPSLKYQRFMTLGSKDIGIRKSEFVAKTQFLCGEKWNWLRPENKRQKQVKKNGSNLKKNPIYDEKCAGLLHTKERSKTHKIWQLKFWFSFSAFNLVF